MSTANFIPRIEYANVTTTGNTHSNTTLDNLGTTVGVTAGMLVIGSGITDGITVLSVDSSSKVTLSAAASTSLTGTAIRFTTRFDFTYPFKKDDGESLTRHVVQAFSITGIEQTQFIYNEAMRTVLFSFLTEAQITSLQTFWTTWASQGKAFIYYTHKSDSTSGLTYKMVSPKFETKRTVPLGLTKGFLYELQLQMRRVL